MGKPLVAVIIGVALLVEVIAFVALGVGTGGFAAASGAIPPSTYSPTWSNDSGATGGALEADVYVAPGTIPFVSAIQPGYPSTTLQVGVQVKSNGNCGNAGDPAWAGGGSSPSYFTISFDNGQSTNFTIGSFQNGNPNIAAGSYTANELTVSYNGTSTGGVTNPYLFYCFKPLNANNVQSTNFGSVIFQFTVVIQGEASGNLNIVFHAGGSLCDGPSGTPNGDCKAADGNLPAGMSPFVNSGNTWSSDSSVSVPLMDGQAAIKTEGDGPWFNGGQISFLATTGFGGVNGYRLGIYNPAVRGGGLATGWTPSNPMQVGNDLPAGTVVTMNIPQGASQNCTTSGCNEFVAVLSSPYINGQLAFPIDISPQYAPGQPTVSDTNSVGTLYPTQGSTVTLTFTSKVTGNNQTPSSFLFEVFYLLPGQSPDDSQTCGQQWVTSPPCQMASIPALAAGNGVYSATYTFTVTNPPINANAIGVVVEAESSQQQASAVTHAAISLAPQNCPPGSGCNPGTGNLALWALWGPILLSAIIVTASLLALVFLGGRGILVVIGGVVVIVVLYGLGLFAQWFAVKPL